jgi:hypothetical protein
MTGCSACVWGEQGASKMQVRDSIGDARQGTADVTPVKAAAVGARTQSHSCLCQFEATLGEGQEQEVHEGMSVALIGSHELLGEWDLGRAVPMIATPRSTFAASMHLPAGTDLDYKYLVKSAPRWDAVDRHLLPTSHFTVVRHLLDHVTPPAGRRCLPTLSLGPADGASKSSRALQQPQRTVGSEHVCRFRLELDSDLDEGQWVGIAGDDEALGVWDLSRCLAMQAHMEHGKTVLSAQARLAGGRLLAYKYVMMRSPLWEQRPGNRALSLPPRLAEWQVPPLPAHFPFCGRVLLARSPLS